MLNIIDKKLLEQIFGNTFVTLANKLINITNKEENQITVRNIDKTQEQIYKWDDFCDYVFYCVYV